MYLRGCTRFERASISQGRIIFEKSFTEFGGGGSNYPEIYFLCILRPLFDQILPDLKLHLAQH